MHIAQPTGAAGRLILHQQQPATYLGLQKNPKKTTKTPTTTKHFTAAPLGLVAGEKQECFT